MAESNQISTSSTKNISSLFNYQIISQNNSSEIPLTEINTKKRFKNLVECYPCSVDDCQILFDSQKELDEHKVTHTKLYKCEFPKCEKSFQKLINLRKHSKIHYKNKKIFTCPYEGCKKSFSAYYSLNSHYRIHTGNMPFRCEICDKKFFDRANWQYHTSNIHKEIIPDKLTCPHKNCGHLSKTVKQLLMHHDKLEEQCVKEKNLLVRLIMFYQNATYFLLQDRKLENNSDFLKFEGNLGVDDEYKNIWINYINNFDLDDDLKKDVSLIKIQTKNVVNSSKNKDKYKGILDTYE